MEGLFRHLFSYRWVLSASHKHNIILLLCAVVFFEFFLIKYKLTKKMDIYFTEPTESLEYQRMYLFQHLYGPPHDQNTWSSLLMFCTCFQLLHSVQISANNTISQETKYVNINNLDLPLQHPKFLCCHRVTNHRHNYMTWWELKRWKQFVIMKNKQ